MTFAEKLNNLLTKRRMSKAEAARIIGCNERSVYFWLDGRRTPKPATQQGIVAMLKLKKATR